MSHLILPPLIYNYSKLRTRIVVEFYEFVVPVWGVHRNWISWPKLKIWVGYPLKQVGYPFTTPNPPIWKHISDLNPSRVNLSHSRREPFSATVNPSQPPWTFREYPNPSVTVKPKPSCHRNLHICHSLTLTFILSALRSLSELYHQPELFLPSPWNPVSQSTLTVSCLLNLCFFTLYALWVFVFESFRPIVFVFESFKQMGFLECWFYMFYLCKLV